MKASELRIGNYTEFRTGRVPGEWALNIVDYKDLEYISDDPNDYRPIPLTEKWLEDFWFEYFNFEEFISWEKIM